MPITITKTTKAAKYVDSKSVKPVAVKSEADVKAERIVAAQTELKAAKKVVADYEVDRKFLAALLDETAKPEDEVVYNVEGGSVKFSPKTEQTSLVDAKAVHKKLGDAAFYAIAKVSVEDLKKYLSAVELAAFCETKLTGARRISVVVDAVKA